MRLVASSATWPLQGALPEGVRHLALPWSIVAQWVSPRDLAGVRFTDALRKAGVTLVTVVLDPLTCMTDAAFEQQTDDAYMQMQITALLGAAGAVLTSAHGKAEGTSAAGGLEMMRDAAARLSVLAERLGLTLAVRNQCDSAIEQVDMVLAVCGPSGSDTARACVDNVAFQQAAVNPADAVATLAPRMAMLWLGDERRGAACGLGEGAAHVAATMAACRAEGFEGDVVVAVDALAESAGRLAGWMQD